MYGRDRMPTSTSGRTASFITIEAGGARKNLTLGRMYSMYSTGGRPAITDKTTLRDLSELLWEMHTVQCPTALPRPGTSERSRPETEV
jgi:hypothetical protein